MDHMAFGITAIAALKAGVDREAERQTGVQMATLVSNKDLTV
jgi:hypothetical protein